LSRRTRDEALGLGDRYCAGTSKRTGLPCGEYHMPGKRHCYHHGGADGSGRPIVHGLYSEYVPTEWRGDYEYFKSDPNHTSSTSELAVAQTSFARFLKINEGLPLSSEVVEFIVDHTDKISRIKEREAKRLYQQDVMRNVLTGILGLSAGILAEELGAVLQPEEARAVAERFAARVREATQVKPVLTI